ncbi:MAG TPA: peptidase M28, partial [Firmicutes bacterium]|nr:peptidase M28 [Bacillota bacterium]
MEDKERLAFLKAMSEVDGISGHEKAVAQLAMKMVEGYADRVEFDNLGSFLAYKDGEKGQPTILLSGHMDEVGFVVHKIEDSGMLRIHPVGGWWGHVLLAQVMTVTTREGKKYTGVIGAQPPHGMSPEMRKQVLEIKDMYLDLGVTNKE